MKSTLKYLQEKLDIVKNKIASSSDYREMKMLEKIIGEISPPEISPTVTKRIYKRTGKYAGRNRKKSLSDTRISRDTQIAQFVAKVVKEKGGQMDMPALYKELQTHHPDFWAALNKDEKWKPGRITNAINKYNKNKRVKDLILWPQKTKGMFRVGKYESVFIPQEKKHNAS